MNVRKKLTIARRKFLEANVTKTGKNMGIKFKYFELSDIVPSATIIFDELGLFHLVEFDKDHGVATMSIMDADADEVTEVIRFSIPYVEELPRFNKDNVMISNPIQLVGSAQTYLRRYLYMLALDVVEHDEIEQNLTKEQVNMPEEKPSNIPATAQERKAIKEQATEKTYATPEQIKEFKKKLKKLTTHDASNKDFVNEVSIRTNKLTNVEINLFNGLVEKVNEMLKEYEK